MSGVNDGEININEPDNNNNNLDNENENQDNTNEQEEQQQDTNNENEGDQEQSEEENCECKYWSENTIQEKQGEFNDFELWIIDALKIKVPEFKDFVEDSNNFDLIRLTIQETINEVDSDLFIVKLRDCIKDYTGENINIPNELVFYIMFITCREIVKNHKIPVYDHIELREALCYYIAHQFKLREEATSISIGGTIDRLKAGATEIEPKKVISSVDPDYTIYLGKYNNIIKRRRRIRKVYVVSNLGRYCFRYGWHWR